MTEQDILELIRQDKQMMYILKIAEKLQFPDWLIGAGFIRNKVWDHLHGFEKPKNDSSDIDLVYFDPNGNDEKSDKAISTQLTTETGIKWEVVNQAYTHAWHGVAPYTSTKDAISRWPETATCIGVRLEKEGLTLIAPHGINDLVNMIIRLSPGCTGGITTVTRRAQKKDWLNRWPKVKMVQQDP